MSTSGVRLINVIGAVSMLVIKPRRATSEAPATLLDNLQLPSIFLVAAVPTITQVEVGLVGDRTIHEFF